MIQLQVPTHAHEEMLDITPAVRQAVRENGWTDGALLLYCPHTTGAVTVKIGSAQYPKKD